jgi:HEAT repeat protein
MTKQPPIDNSPMLGGEHHVTLTGMEPGLGGDRRPLTGRAGIITEMLGRLGNQQALMTLQAALIAPDSRIRRRAVLALGRIARPEAAEALVGLLQDPHPHVRQAAASSLGNLKDTAAILPLCAAVHDPDHSVRIAAIAVLGQIAQSTSPDRESMHHIVHALNEALNDPDTEVRQWAVRMLGFFIADSRAVPGLLTVLRDDQDEIVRAVAAFALGELRDLRAVTGLSESVLWDTDGRVRCFCVDALGKIGDLGAILALKRALNDPDMEVRANADRAIRDIRAMNR